MEWGGVGIDRLMELGKDRDMMFKESLRSPPPFRLATVHSGPAPSAAPTTQDRRRLWLPPPLQQLSLDSSFSFRYRFVDFHTVDAETRESQLSAHHKHIKPKHGASRHTYLRKPKPLCQNKSSLSEIQSIIHSRLVCDPAFILTMQLLTTFVASLLLLSLASAHGELECG